MRRALVTGIDGAVGEALARALASAEVEVLGLGRPRSRATPDGIGLVHGDPSDVALVGRVLAEYEPDTVFHLPRALAEAEFAPARAFEQATRAAWAVLEAVRRTRGARAVVVPVPHPAGTLDGAALAPAGPGTVAQACAERVARSYATTYDLPIGIAHLGVVALPELCAALMQLARRLHAGERPGPILLGTVESHAGDGVAGEVLAPFPGWHGVPVLVTGARGFLGRHLVQRLRAEQARVTLAPDALENLDAGAVPFAPQVVFHLAASIDLAPGAAARRANVHGNLGGTLRVLEAALEWNARALVFTSSSAVYGRGPIPFDERQTPHPTSSYARSKLGAERLCRIFHDLGLATRVVRLSTVFGPGQSPARLVPAVIRAGLDGVRLAMGDPQQRRDLVYVRDAVDGLLAAARCDALDGQVVNLGHERPLSVRELVERIRARTGGPEPDYGARPARAGEALVWASSGRKARRLLAWTPRVALEDALDETVAHYRSLSTAKETS